MRTKEEIAAIAEEITKNVHLKRHIDEYYKEQARRTPVSILALSSIGLSRCSVEKMRAAYAEQLQLQHILKVHKLYDREVTLEDLYETLGI